MMKRIDWKAKEAYAKGLTVDQLHFAIKDCLDCVDIWSRYPELGDPDGNAAYYSDEASVYRRELESRNTKKGKRKGGQK